MRIPLRKNYFTEKECTFVDFDSFKAALFIYQSGVHGVKLENESGYIIVLPFKEQQIWDAFFHGRRLTMKSTFPQPRDVNFFLDTYGCFLMHCGARRMGCPGPEDDHPLHGELPYADYDAAEILVDEDEKGKYIGISGVYEYKRAFGDKYQACPLIKLHGESLLDVSITIENQSNYPMELMYLCHINFRPVDYGRIVQSADWTSKYIELRQSFPEHIKVSQEFIDFLNKLKSEPKLTEVIKPEDEYDPEVVFFLRCPKVDAEGWSHFTQVHPDGSADYVGYKPEELDHCTRWISRTKNQKALGIAFPATSDPEGYTAEKKKGSVKEIPA